MPESLDAAIIARTWRVPLPDTGQGDGAAAARQLDSVIMRAGFKLSRDLMERLSAMPTGDVLDLGVRVIGAVREAAGDHVQHNTYFRDFPFGVPDTMEFWVASLRQALLDPVAARNVEAGFIRLPSGGTGYSDADAKDDGDKLVLGWLNLLSLPNYGTYQHTYEEMLAAHDELIPHAKDRVTVLHAGGTVAVEASRLYLELAGSAVPLNGDDLALLQVLAVECVEVQPERIPVRENRAVINAARLAQRLPLLTDTVTDVLRLAAAVSGGDVTLETVTRFGSFTRPERRILLAALDGVVTGSRAKLSDVARYSEQWKRLGERLHPHEHPYPAAREVFTVARGEHHVQSITAAAEANIRDGAIGRAAQFLEMAPGLLWRSADRLLRSASSDDDLAAVISALEDTVQDVSGRVLLSVREHLANRLQPTDVSRVFANRKGRAWVTGDDRKPLDTAAVVWVTAAIDREIVRRLPDLGQVLVDPVMLGVALPLSGKAAPGGLGMMPRGSVSLVDGEVLRFFVYWKQHAHRTDYDLSALMLDSTYGYAEHVSWTNYHAGGYATYSGDITSAPDGATEFIDIQLPKVTRQIIIPTVNIYSGEGFDEAEEAFFGFMIRDGAQKGAPFEARTVRMKSDLRGAGRVALPLAFTRGDDGKWRAKWLHLYLRGQANFGTVERNKVTTSLLTRAVIERDYLRVAYLTSMLGATAWDGTTPDGPVTLIAPELPEGLPEGSRVITLQNLGELIPE